MFLERDLLHEMGFLNRTSLCCDRENRHRILRKPPPAAFFEVRFAGISTALGRISASSGRFGREKRIPKTSWRRMQSRANRSPAAYREKFREIRYHRGFSMRVFKIWAAFLGCGAWAGKISGKNRESGVCGGTFLFLDQAVLRRLFQGWTGTCSASATCSVSVMRSPLMRTKPESSNCCPEQSYCA